MAVTHTDLDDTFGAVSQQCHEFHADAEAVAAEHGHVLGAWYHTGGLRTAARCTQCTATVCLKRDGNNNDPLRWLAGRECSGPRDRFYVAKSKANGVVYFVRDRERPKYGPLLMSKKAGLANAEAKRLNGGAEPVDALEVAKAKVTRLRAQLAKAEAALEAVAA